MQHHLSMSHLDDSFTNLLSHMLDDIGPCGHMSEALRLRHLVDSSGFEMSTEGSGTDTCMGIVFGRTI